MRILETPVDIGMVPAASNLALLRCAMARLSKAAAKALRSNSICCRYMASQNEAWW